MKGIREKEISRELTLCIGRGKAIFPFLLNSNSIYWITAAKSSGKGLYSFKKKTCMTSRAGEERRKVSNNNCRKSANKDVV